MILLGGAVPRVLGKELTGPKETDMTHVLPSFNVLLTILFLFGDNIVHQWSALVEVLDHLLEKFVKKLLCGVLVRLTILVFHTLELEFT